MGINLSHLQWGMYPPCTLVFFPVTSLTLTSPFSSFLHFPSLFSHRLTSHSLTLSNSPQLPWPRSTTTSLLRIQWLFSLPALTNQRPLALQAALFPLTLPAGFSTLFPEPPSSVHCHHGPCLGSGPAVGSLSDSPWVLFSRLSLQFPLWSLTAFELWSISSKLVSRFCSQKKINICKISAPP